jgi:tRNA G18 (ribose-2'-O)-methylase SpoU
MRKLENNENLLPILKAQQKHLIIVLDDVRSLHNIGSVFRTADAF